MPKQRWDRRYGWTVLTQPSQSNGPIRCVQILNFLEVPISRNQDHPVAFRRGGNPDVVLGNRPPFLLQVLFESPVFRATSKSAEAIALPDANRSTLAVFSEGRPDFAAPKNTSPITTAGTNTSAQGQHRKAPRQLPPGGQ